MKRINMERILVLTILLSFILIGTASADEVLYIKIKSLGLEKSWNSYRVAVNITTDTTGNLTYIEEYYTVDSNDNPKLYSGTRYETEITELTGNSISFEIFRPRDKSGKVYSLIKAKILLNRNVVFDEWIPLDSHYKMDNLKNASKNMSMGNRSARGKVVTTRPPFRPINISENKTVIEPTEKVPGFDRLDVIMVMTIASSICIYRKRACKKN